jgi:NADH-quinone oxidoreductase subunit N
MADVLRSTAQLLPEVILAVALLLIVLVDASLTRLRGRIAHVTSALALAAALVALLRERLVTTGPKIWSGMVVLDPLGVAFKTLILGAALVLVLAYTFRNARELRGLGPAELYALLLAATLSALLLVSANDLAMLYLSLEMLSLSSYVLVAYIKGDRMSNEASLKYLLFGAASTGAMLYGLSLIYGMTGTTSLPGIQEALVAGLSETNRLTLYVAVVFVFAGFGFKTAAVPFHFWCPDAYEGAPTPVTAFLSVAPKVAGFAILTRFFYGSLATPLMNPWDLAPSLPWPALLAVISVVTMTVGNVAALTQTNMKRLLAYSSIAHAGYILMGLVALSENGARGVLIYLFAYLLMNLGAFLVVMLIHHHEGTFDVRDYPGLLRRAPLLAVALTLFLLSLVGIPPLVGFVGKLYVFAAVVEKSRVTAWYGWLALVGALNAAVAAFYYFRVLKAMLIDSEEEADSRPGYSLALADRTWVVVLVLANLAPLFVWRFVERWAQAALTLSAGR